MQEIQESQEKIVAQEKSMLFKSSFGLEIPLEAVVQEIIRFMNADPLRHYKIIIGSDSAQLSQGDADFVSAIVVHRVGNGGRYFWRRIELLRFHTLRDRIIQEVLLSLELAEKLLLELKGKGENLSWDFEIHADVGENGETRVLIQEVTGMIRAYNFEVKTKPNGYAATKVADKHV